MDFIFQVAKLIIFYIINILAGPLSPITGAGIVYWLVVVLIAFQYRRLAKRQMALFGFVSRSYWRDTLVAVGHGILGGILGSFVLVLLGVSLKENEIAYLWPLALLLMLINPRFLCFSYAGGIVSLSYLIFGFPQVRIPQLMALVAVLHMVESFLIQLGGHLGAMPVYTRDRFGRVVGGYTLQKFWPIPVVALLLLQARVPAEGVIATPEWWPLLKNQVPADALFVLVPLVAGLGYGDLALARTPQEKSRVSAFNLATFSVILLALALLASRYQMAAWAAALFSPLGHELVIYLGRRMEFRPPPLFVEDSRGIRVLAVVPGSAAEKAGLEPGDVIISVNGLPVSRRYQLESALLFFPPFLEIEYFSRRQGKVHRAMVAAAERLGIITVPEEGDEALVEMDSRGFLPRLWERMGKKEE